MKKIFSILVILEEDKSNFLRPFNSKTIFGMLERGFLFRSSSLNWTKLESESGKGTTLSFTANFGLGKETEKKSYVPSRDLRDLKVLVVDDSATSRGILRDIL